MAEDERRCVACQQEHYAAAWYARKSASGPVEYLCGAKYLDFADKASWVQDFPRRDD